MKIVTSGAPYIDIDAYACIISYSELLQKQGIDAVPFSSSKLNESITNSVRAWYSVDLKKYIPTKQDQFIIVDSSNPDSLDRQAEIERVEAVLDHRTYFVNRWKSIDLTGVEIDAIGAAATLIYEKWQKSSLSMSDASAKLLLTAIIDNTLGLRSWVTTDRDKRALSNLQKIAKLPKDWEKRYFKDCEKSILTDVGSSLENDTKVHYIENIGLTLNFAQLVVWDANKLMQSEKELLSSYLNNGSNWLLNLIGIKQNTSYFMCSNEHIVDWLQELVGPLGKDDYALYSGRPYLRKELLEIDLKRTDKIIVQ